MSFDLTILKLHYLTRTLTSSHSFKTLCRSNAMARWRLAGRKFGVARDCRYLEDHPN